MSLDFGKRVVETRKRIREERPLVHFITNMVTMNDVANATLAIGALPVMAHSPVEVAEMVASAGALVLNTGTPSPKRVEAMLLAGQKACELGLPILLDPVGAGATAFRLDLNRRLLNELRITVLKGNQGEIAALLGKAGTLKGVETVKAVDDPLLLSHRAAREFKTVAAVTGEHDFVSDGERGLRVENGHPMMKVMSGAGCVAGAVVGAFLAVGEEPLLAAAEALALFGLAGEKAARESRGPGSFKTALLDALYTLSDEEIEKGIRISQEAQE